jgi:glycosyltransferase involved in cell wall biosynthesis
MDRPLSKQLRILYAAGPGDVIGTYRYWKDGQEDPSIVAMTYSGQFYEVCRDLDAQAYVISAYQRVDRLCDGRFILENRPIPLSQASGLLYHLGLVWYGLRLIAAALRFRADVAVVSTGSTHWFVLSLLPLLGVQVVPSLHCVFWRKYVPMRRVERWLNWLNRSLFCRCTRILSISPDVSEQVDQITQGNPAPIVPFVPTYQASEFVAIPPPNWESLPFRVLFAGRIEADKGVFDLLEIAQRLAAAGESEIVFDLCGGGSDLERLQQAARAAKLDTRFICYGHCNKPKMQELLGRSHVVIVPTTTDSLEGFNKVVVEGVLVGRPVITSSVCPALGAVQAAVVEVPPNDVKAYGDAILKLRDDRAFYWQKQRACLRLRQPFFDSSRSWAAALKSVLLAMQPQSKQVTESP